MKDTYERSCKKSNFIFSNFPKTHQEILHFTALLIQTASNDTIIKLLSAIKDLLPRVSRLEALWLLSSFHFLILKYGLAPSRLAWRRSLVKNCSMGPWLATPLPTAAGAPLPSPAPSPTLALLPRPWGPAAIISIWAKKEMWMEGKTCWGKWCVCNPVWQWCFTWASLFTRQASPSLRLHDLLMSAWWLPGQLAAWCFMSRPF